MANPARGTVALQAGDTAYTVSYSINALCELEEAAGKPIMKIVESLSAAGDDASKIRMSDLRLLIWGSLIDNYPDMDQKGAGRVAAEAGIPACMEAIGKALALAFPPEQAGGATKPRPRKAAKG